MNNIRLNKWFSSYEFTCKCGCGTYIHNEELIEMLNDVREYFGKPVRITSGTRCPAHNAAVGGVPDSQHTLGTAADIQVSGISPEETYAYLTDKYPGKFGFGLYSTFVHCDVRPNGPARW